MRESFIKIFNNYINMYNSPFKPTVHELAAFIEKELPNLIQHEVSINSNKYIIEGSVGQGNWTGTPWISVFDKDITNTAQKGFYIVYLFRKDMQGVYLSLNQGTKYIKGKFKGQKPKEKMTTIASNIRNTLVYDSNQFNIKQIDLATKVDNGTNYMAAHICGKYYPLSNMPSNSELIDDLQEMISLYSQLKALMAGRTIEEMLDFYLQKDEIEDTQFQNDVLVATAANTKKEPQTIPAQIKTKSKDSWKRNPSVAKEALQNANYLCEYDSTHLTFTSEITNHNFVEAHHLIPIRNQADFQWSLDVPGNIVSLCPNCHRKIHHGQRKEKFEVIEKLFLKRYLNLKDFGLDIDMKELKKIYK